jgi:hypothetical protein
MHVFVDRLFSAQHKAPEVSSVLLECTLGKLRTGKGAKKFLNVEMGKAVPKQIARSAAVALKIPAGD